LIEINPWRGAPEFADTVKSTAPLPCPVDDEVKVIQSTSTDAFQVQSRSAATATAPFPPPASICGIEPVTETVHLVVDGLVKLVVERAHPLDPRNTAAASRIVTRCAAITSTISEPYFSTKSASLRQPAG
jgi:hypothetical protein